jgi:peptidoglycan-associated lipoprotein
VGAAVFSRHKKEKLMRRLFLAGAAILILSACATKPEPVTEVVQTAPIEKPAPPVVQPAEPLPPIIQEAPAQVVEIAPQADLPTPGSEEDFAFQSGGEPRVFFGYDQYDLSVEARDVLRRQANWLNIYTDASADIEGHADERGTREYNLALGARRAESVKSFLISQGVAPHRLNTISYGKERPIDARSNEAGWARNRNGYTNLRIRGVS